MKSSKRKQGESLEDFQRRIENARWAAISKPIDDAATKTGMKGIGQSRNLKWRIAEMERKAFGAEEDNW
jgi:hypothetical protein